MVISCAIVPALALFHTVRARPVPLVPLAVAHHEKPEPPAAQDGSPDATVKTFPVEPIPSRAMFPLEFL